LSQLPGYHLRRPRLTDRVLGANACVIIGGAGYGKVGVPVAVLDAGMPSPAGWEVARQLRADPATAAVRTVVLWPDGSGQGGPAEQPGVDACLAKPFGPAELVALVHGLAGPAGPAAG
jgi:CheY-like chemotaxis protein